MKIFVLLLIILILSSLGSALYFLLHDKGQSDRTVKALTVRISLSVILFAFLMASYYFGWVPKRGL